MRLVLVLLLAVPAAAQPLFPRFSILGAGYSGQMNTEIRLDPETTGLPPGTRINLERDLGLRTNNEIKRFAVEWRPLSRHQLDASYFSARRTGFRNINEPITFGNQTYPVNAAVSTQMGVDFRDLDYTYWARKTDTNGIGVTLGVSALKINAQVAAQRANEPTITLREDANTDVPVPLIGLQFRQAITSRLLFEARGAFLPNVKVQEIRADARTGNARLEYRMARFLGIGAGYNYFDLQGDVSRSGFLGTLHMRVQGAELYARLVY